MPASIGKKRKRPAARYVNSRSTITIENRAIVVPEMSVHRRVDLAPDNGSGHAITTHPTKVGITASSRASHMITSAVLLDHDSTTRATLPALLLNELLKICNLLANVVRAGPDYFRTQLTPHSVTPREGTPELRGFAEIFSVDSEGILTSGACYSYRKRRQDKIGPLFAFGIGKTKAIYHLVRDLSWLIHISISRTHRTKHRIPSISNPRNDISFNTLRTKFMLASMWPDNGLPILRKIIQTDPTLHRELIFAVKGEGRDGRWIGWVLRLGLVD